MNAPDTMDPTPKLEAPYLPGHSALPLNHKIYTVSLRKPSKQRSLNAQSGQISKRHTAVLYTTEPNVHPPPVSKKFCLADLGHFYAKNSLFCHYNRFFLVYPCKLVKQRGPGG